MQFQATYFMVSISTTLSGKISHARLFLLVSCGTLGRCSRNPGVPRNPVENHCLANTKNSWINLPKRLCLLSNCFILC